MGNPRLRHSPVQLGDAVKSALTLIGVTEERVTRLLGRPCGCGRRATKLNRLSDWAYTLLRGGTAPPPDGDVQRAREELDRIVGEAPSPSPKPRSRGRGKRGTAPNTHVDRGTERGEGTP